MPEPLLHLAVWLRALGAAHLLLHGVAGGAALLWALRLTSRKPVAPAVVRGAGTAAVLLASALLLSVGQRFGDEGPALWQWLLGLLALPWLIHLPRVGGMAAFGSLLCLAGVLAGLVRYVAPPEPVTGGLLAAGLLALLLSAALERLTRGRLPPPPAVDAQALAQRLGSDEAAEAADKYTRD